MCVQAGMILLHQKLSDEKNQLCLILITMISPTEILTLRSEAVKVEATTLVCCEGSECALVPITPLLV